MKDALSGFLSAFPDLSVVIEDMVAEGDRVATRGTLQGTHQAEFMGMPATGKHVTVQFIEIDRIRDGKFVDHWEQVDMMGMMEQLGMAPGG